MAVPRFQYSEGDTVMHRLSPLTKLLVLVLLSVSLFLFEEWYVAVALAILIPVLYAHGRVGIKRLVAVVKPLPPFVLLIVLAHVFLVCRSDPLQAAILRGLLQALRVTVLLAAASLFMTVTEPVSLADSVLYAVGPFMRGRSAGALSLMVMIIFSFLPHLAGETARLRMAQLVRCGPRRGWFGGLRGVMPLVAPLVIGVFRRAEEMELSLNARCYNIDTPRRSLSRPGMMPVDIIVITASLLIFAVGVYAKLQADR